MEYLIHTTVKGVDLTFATDGKCFSPRHVDLGTLALLAHADVQKGRKTLDLGCGYGAIGIVCTKLSGAESVTMSDIDEHALALARENAERNGVPGVKILRSDGFDAIPDSDFDLILSNPPYHADFSVAKRFIEGSRRHLKNGGKLLMVTKRREWYKRKFIAVFGGVTIFGHGGYFVFAGEKRSKQPEKEHAKMDYQTD